MSRIQPNAWYLVANSSGSLVRRKGVELGSEAPGSERLRIVRTTSTGATVVEREVVKPQRPKPEERSNPRILIAFGGITSNGMLYLREGSEDAESAGGAHAFEIQSSVIDSSNLVDRIRKTSFDAVVAPLYPDGSWEELGRRRVVLDGFLREGKMFKSPAQGGHFIGEVATGYDLVRRLSLAHELSNLSVPPIILTNYEGNPVDRSRLQGLSTRVVTTRDELRSRLAQIAQTYEPEVSQGQVEETKKAREPVLDEPSKPAPPPIKGSYKVLVVGASEDLKTKLSGYYSGHPKHGLEGKSLELGMEVRLDFVEGVDEACTKLQEVDPVESPDQEDDNGPYHVVIVPVYQEGRFEEMQTYVRNFIADDNTSRPDRAQFRQEYTKLTELARQGTLPTSLLVVFNPEGAFVDPIKIKHDKAHGGEYFASSACYERELEQVLSDDVVTRQVGNATKLSLPKALPLAECVYSC